MTFFKGNFNYIYKFSVTWGDYGSNRKQIHPFLHTTSLTQVLGLRTILIFSHMELGTARIEGI